MSTTIPLRPAPPRPSRRQPARAPRRAALYVVGLLWALPLLAFTVAALRADATPCRAVDALPCDDQGMVVLTGVLVGVLLIPVGLLALLVVATLERSPLRPAAVAAVACAVALAVGGAVVGVGLLVLTEG